MYSKRMSEAYFSLNHYSILRFEIYVTRQNATAIVIVGLIQAVQQ